MAQVHIEHNDDESGIRLRVGEPGFTTCVEILNDDIPKAIKALVAWLAWTDEKAAAALLKDMRRR